MIDEIIDRLTDSILDHAERNWREYIDNDGTIHLLRLGDEIDKAYYRVYGEDCDDDLYDRLKVDKSIKDACGEIYSIVLEKAEEYRSNERYYNGTMYEQLRERGLSIHDFV